RRAAGPGPHHGPFRGGRFVDAGGHISDLAGGATRAGGAARPPTSGACGGALPETDAYAVGVPFPVRLAVRVALAFTFPSSLPLTTRCGSGSNRRSRCP